MEFFNNLSSFLTEAISEVQSLAPILAAAAFVVFALMYAFGGQQASQMAKTRGVQVIVGLLIVWGVSALVNTLIELSGTRNASSISIGYVQNVFQVSIPYVRSVVGTMLNVPLL